MVAGARSQEALGAWGDLQVEHCTHRAPFPENCCIGRGVCPAGVVSDRLDRMPACQVRLEERQMPVELRALPDGLHHRLPRDR